MLRAALALAILTATATVIAVGARPLPATEPAAVVGGLPADAMAASVALAIGDLPEVFALTDGGDVLPAAGNALVALPQAVPTSDSSILYTRILAPKVEGPRRVGIQVGHWQTEQAPPDLWRLIAQTGTSWNGVREVDINLEISKRVAAILGPKDIVVDILPTTIPPGYVADAFVALHADGDGAGVNSGYKLAHAARRSPFEEDLLLSIATTYGAATGLPSDQLSVGRNMTNYFAFSWQRNRWSTSPHTPSVILEMGYVSHDGDRAVLTEKTDVVAAGIADGIVRFLDAHPRDLLFGKDLLVPARPQFRPTPAP